MTAYVHPTAVVGDNYKPAPFTLIDAEVVIGANVITGSFVHVRFGARIGDNVLVGDHVTIHDGAVVGARQRARRRCGHRDGGRWSPSRDSAGDAARRRVRCSASSASSAPTSSSPAECTLGDRVIAR